MKKIDQNEKDSPIDNKVEEVKGMLKVNKAAALGLAVVLTLSTALSGCTIHKEEEEEDESYYSGGSGHFYYRGGSFNSSTWSKFSPSFSSHRYSAPRFKGIGG